ncbi:MAG TPA: IS200/IS605 family transposase [Terriglobales bacterium]|nr:IS200/IS605 family transposase [Terriglobales bacterium]
MPQSLVSNRVHVIFSTRERRPWITLQHEQRLWNYVLGIGKNKGIPVLAVGGMEDHIHVLIALPAAVPLAKAVQIMKANSSRFMRERGAHFEWQRGYGGFSVGASAVDATIEYIRNQKKHHQKRDFKAEFLAFLKRYDVEYDPRYVFD